jgi:hypothetical protein
MAGSPSRVRKKDIEDERHGLEHRLHAAHLALGDDMDAFQRQWDADPAAAFAASAAAGWSAAGADWLVAPAPLFDRAAWRDLGAAVGKGEPPCSADERVDDPDYRWEWWHRAIAQRSAPPYDGAAAAGATLVGPAALSKKIYRHRAAILALPTQIGNDGMAAAEHFLDTVLADIDAELVADIRGDPSYPIVREVFDDHEGAVTYYAYLDLMWEAIPPNFYAHVAGRAAPYYMMEVALMAAIAPFSTGMAVALRLRALTEALEANAAARDQDEDGAPAKAAIATFARAIDDFSRAADDLHTLGDLLMRTRSQGGAAAGLLRRLRAWLPSRQR